MKLEVLVRVYDGCKYERGSKKIDECEFAINGYRVAKGEEIDISGLTDSELDEYNEYLVLFHADGGTSTFRNSHVDMFRKY